MVIRLPFYCQPIPAEHRFGDVVGNVFAEGTDGLIDGVKIDAARIAHIGLRQSWATPIGAEENQERMRAMIREGRVTGLTLKQYEATDKTRNDPYLSLTLTLPEPHPQEVVWYWHGDGSYDNFSASEPGREPPTTPEA